MCQAKYALYLTTRKRKKEKKKKRKKANDLTPPDIE